MPCGGILPLAEADRGSLGFDCFYCHKTGVDHWIEEWDAFIHYDCVFPFLQTEEGKVLIRHRHDIVLEGPGDRFPQKDPG